MVCFILLAVAHSVCLLMRQLSLCIYRAATLILTIIGRIRTSELGFVSHGGVLLNTFMHNTKSVLKLITEPKAQNGIFFCQHDGVQDMYRLVDLSMYMKAGDSSSKC